MFAGRIPSGGGVILPHPNERALMDRHHRDALIERRAVASETIADELKRARLHRERQEAIIDNRRPLQRIFGGEHGGIVLLRSIPGFAGLWETVVPDKAILTTTDRLGVRWQIVLCSCGEQVALRPGALAECCEGSRWYLHGGGDVRFKQFERVAA